MLISFSVENWMSFRDRATLSMIAGREHQHGERVPLVGKYPIRVLPVAAIYGGNASGKTNLFKALNFAKRLVVKGTQPDSLIPVQAFRLDSECATKPTRFWFELLIDEMIYEFSFAVTSKAVVEERLVRVASTSEKVLYDRRDGKISLDRSLEKDEFLRFAFKGTRDNQLFLTNSVSQKVETFSPVYDWFKNILTLIAPDSRFEQFEKFLDASDPLFSTMNAMLPQLDTGIERLGVEEIPFENIRLPEELRQRLQEDIKEGMAVRLVGSLDHPFVIFRPSGELIAKKMITYHRTRDGKEVEFNVAQESDGSRRVIDLLPAFVDICEAGSRSVFVIDEMDRSLHTLLTRGLLEAYFARCSSESRAQLLFTTHDIQLMDQRLLRRDEMWVTERDAVGASSLIPFSDFKDIRKDKDIRKSYLQGRMGGVPRIRLGGVLTCGQGDDNGGAND